MVCITNVWTYICTHQGQILVILKQMYKTVHKMMGNLMISINNIKIGATHPTVIDNNSFKNIDYQIILK